MYITTLTLVVLSLASGNAHSSTMERDTECHTPNGADYRGTQTNTLVTDDGPIKQEEDCLPWIDKNLPEHLQNATLPKNYCRNPDNRLFPWCYVKRNGGPKAEFCHIPTCYTPALLGCFKVFMSEDPPPAGTTHDIDLILDGDDSVHEDPEMRIGRCVNFCRSRRYDFAGLTRGNTCLCGTKRKDGKQLKDVRNILHPHDCLVKPCTGDKMQACGSDTTIAVYDVDVGSCEVTYYERDSGTIYSPRWPGKNYNESRCAWTVFVPQKFRKTEEIMARHALQISFSYFNVEHTFDYLKLYTYKNGTDNDPLMRAWYSRDTHLPTDFTIPVSEVYAIHIIFASNEGIIHGGFILHYKVYATIAEPTSSDVVKVETPVTTFTNRVTTQGTRTPDTIESTTIKTTSATPVPSQTATRNSTILDTSITTSTTSVPSKTATTTSTTLDLSKTTGTTSVPSKTATRNSTIFDTSITTGTTSVRSKTATTTSTTFDTSKTTGTTSVPSKTATTIRTIFGPSITTSTTSGPEKTASTTTTTSSSSKTLSTISTTTSSAKTMTVDSVAAPPATTSKSPDTTSAASDTNRGGKISGILLGVLLVRIFIA